MRTPLRYFGKLCLILLIFAAGFTLGQVSPTVYANDHTIEEEQLTRIERVWELIHEQYYIQPVDEERLIQGAISGMLGALEDNHTSYMPPEEFEMQTENFEGSYTGIGALVEAEGDRLLIVSPFDGSPAKEAGLRPGDEILKVDNTPVSDFDDPLSAITLVRGPSGEPVTLLVRRNQQEFEVTIIRDRIPLISVNGEMREDGLGYVRIANFGQQTMPQLRETLSEILSQRPEGLILDLRGNPGGALTTALQVADEFINQGDLMIEKWGDGREVIHAADPGGLAASRDLPLIVLIDGGSASASEIVAAAIQENGRGKLLGETSYGKGTVQNWIDLGNGGGGVRITIARWLTAEGKWIDQKGVTPDIQVKIDRMASRTGQDQQLESAAHLLLGKPLPKPSEPSKKIGKLWKCIE